MTEPCHQYGYRLVASAVLVTNEPGLNLCGRVGTIDIALVVNFVASCTDNHVSRLPAPTVVFWLNHAPTIMFPGLITHRQSCFQA